RHNKWTLPTEMAKPTPVGFFHACPPPGQNAQKIEQIGIFHCPAHPPNLDPNNPTPRIKGHNKND
ncbi:hypothetical protein, partial [Pseudomonas brassicacearum]|uniref:hypothetical protein n=1 Tax=Pseudomonas brassicacearum TaxID=930166 RepID=UPI001C82F396